MANQRSSPELVLVILNIADRTEIELLTKHAGINYCFAKLLLENHCNVVIADLGLRPEAQKLIDDYTTQPRAVFVKTNVVMWDELNNMFDVAEKEFGGADIVCQLLHRSPF